MKRSRKSNRVSWASGLNLCQVRLFLSEDCPSKVGGQVQDNLQKKASWLLPQSSSKESNDLPPGFEGSHVLNPYKNELSCVLRVQWKCPPKFVVSCNWCVTAGEDSQESEAQKLREMRVLEAVYPRPSSVPSSPAVSLEVEDEIYDDRLTPMIPLIPVEEEEATEVPSALTEPLKSPSISQSPVLPAVSLSSGSLNSSKCNSPALNPPASQNPELGGVHDPGTHLITPASAAIMKNKEQGSMIDADLLVKILRDPKMIEKLISGSQAPPVTSRLVTSSISPLCAEPAMVSVPSHPNGKLQHLTSEELPWLKPMDQIPISCPRPPPVHLPTMPSNGSLHHQHSQVLSTVSRTSLHQDTVPATGLGVASSIAVPIPEPGKVSAPWPPLGNLFSTSNSVQTTPSTMRTEPSAPQISYLKGVNPNPMFDLVNSSLVKKPIQPNSVRHAGMKTNLVKDMGYIKNLIKEHGMVKKETRDSFDKGSHYYNHIQNPDSVQNLKKREWKPKFQKPCMYFKTPKGCRNGFDCPFQHDMSFHSTLDHSAAKKMKYGGEITTGRT